MKFKIESGNLHDVSDMELSALLTEVYVEGGFTTPDEATTLFNPTAVRERGMLIYARATPATILAGIVILVPPESSARRLAQENEAEIHLLAVKPAYRHSGLGRTLVSEAVKVAGQKRYTRIVLWTQLSMTAARHLYESMNFVHINNITRNGRDFLVYEKILVDQ